MITFKQGEQEEVFWANMMKCIWKAHKALGQCPWFIQVSAAWYDVCKTSCICGKSPLVLSANKQKKQQRHDRSPEIWSCLMHTTTSRWMDCHTMKTSEQTSGNNSSHMSYGAPSRAVNATRDTDSCLSLPQWPRLVSCVKLSTLYIFGRVKRGCFLVWN